MPSFNWHPKSRHSAHTRRNRCLLSCYHYLSVTTPVSTSTIVTSQQFLATIVTKPSAMVTPPTSCCEYVAPCRTSGWVGPWVPKSPSYVVSSLNDPHTSDVKQESPAVTDKPARRESMPEIAPIRRAYNVVADNTGLSSFVSLLWSRNLRNPEKFSENSNL